MCDPVHRMHSHSPQLFHLASAAAHLVPLLHATAAPTAQELGLTPIVHKLKQRSGSAQGLV